jgi:hypothetical protein
MKGNRLLVGAVVLVVLAGLYAAACTPSPGSQGRKNFSEAEVAEIKALLTGVEPGTYRIVLPTFRDGQIVGSETLGNLPLTEVQRLAASQNKQVTEHGNLQAIFASCSGGGAGSHVESQTPGSDLGDRIEKILTGIDQSAYVFIR